MREAQGSFGREQEIKRLGLFPSEPEAPAGPCGTGRAVGTGACRWLAGAWEPTALSAAPRRSRAVSRLGLPPEPQHVGNTPRAHAQPDSGLLAIGVERFRWPCRPPGACGAGARAAARGETRSPHPLPAVRRSDSGGPGLLASRPPGSAELARASGRRRGRLDSPQHTVTDHKLGLCGPHPGEQGCALRSLAPQVALGQQE